MHARIIVSCFVERMKIWTIVLNVEYQGTSIKKNGGDDGEDSMDERKKGTPRKVAWYFPLISKLQRMFANKKDAKLLRWHEEGRNKD